MLNDTPIILSIQLNNLLRRIDCKIGIKALVTQHGGSLKRIRRSKNWVLMGTENQLLAISEQLQHDKNDWIARTIIKALPKPTLNLTLIAHSTSGMTINRLMTETGCTLIEARAAIDHAEGFS